jgi:EF hand domain-containing protein
MEIIPMNLKTALAIAVAAAFAVPLAAQASVDTDRIIVAQQGTGSSTAPIHSGGNAADRPANEPKSGAGATARGGFSSLDQNHDGYISRDEARDASWANRFSELDKDNDGRLSQSEFNAMNAGSGATGKSNAPLTSGTNAADRKSNAPRQ